jgi:hypothetical protein
MRPMRQGGKSPLKKSRGRHGSALQMKGHVDIFVYHHGRLVDQHSLENIIFFQGNGAIIQSLSTISPSTLPAIINRMAVGDQGTIPSSAITPKVPTKDLPQVLATNGLYHEVYRKDVDSRLVTVNNGTTFTISGTLTNGSPLITTADTTGIANGMSVSGTGIPANSIVESVNSPTQFTIGPSPATVGGVHTLTMSGAANQVQFIAEFDASAVALSAFTFPSTPTINEVGLVLINPAAPDGITRSAVTAPTTPPSDEVVMSIRTFPSIPFNVANNVSVTFRYTIYME